MVSDETVFAAPGRWADGSWVRFWQGSWQVKGGWEKLLLDNLGGVCRSVYGWQDQAETLCIAFGLHNGLRGWVSGTYSDITPQYNFLAQSLGNDPLSTTITTPTVVVAQPGHGFSVGQSVAISGAPPFNGIVVTGTWTITAVTLDTWTFTAGANATATGAGGGALVLVQNQTAWQAGAINGTGGAGYGAGAWSVGTYSTPSLLDYFPASWSLANYGADLMANPRGKTIYRWVVGAARALPLPGAPRKVTYMVVAPQRQVMAFGCNESVSGVFNPLCIRWSDIEDPEDWNELATNNSGEWVLESGGSIVCARVVGDYVLVWTTAALFLGTFLGDPGQTWKFERVGSNCGAISPGSPVVRSLNAAWIAPDRQFWTYSLGSDPRQMDNPVRNAFANNISRGQDDKIVGSGLSIFGEITWFYPDERDGLENSRAITVAADGWSRDVISRTAFMDAGPADNPVGVNADGWAYWHEQGKSADGGTLSGFLESTDFYMAEADGGLMVNGIWPDLKSQESVFAMTITGREYPQSTERTFGPWALPPDLPKKSFRMATRIARVRFDFSAPVVFARGGKPTFDVAPIGGR